MASVVICHRGESTNAILLNKQVIELPSKYLFPHSVSADKVPTAVDTIWYWDS